MSTLSARERGDMAEQLLPIAAHLAVLVHGDGGPRDVHQVLARLDAGQKDALIVVLAGLVDPEQPMSRALGWVDFDEHGDLSVPAGWAQSGTVRDLAPEPVVEDDDLYVDEVAVDQYLAGVPVVLTKRERLTAVVKAQKLGLSFSDLDRMHGLSNGYTNKFLQRERLAYEQRGELFPELVRTDVATAAFEDHVVVEIRERYAAGGVTDMELGLAYGVSRNVITNLLNGSSYKNVGGPIRPKRKDSKPKAATRVIWGGSNAGYVKQHHDAKKEMAA